MVKKSVNSPDIPPERVLAVVALGLAGVLVLYILFTGMYSVRAHEQAVVLRFGRFLRTDGPGLHFKMPYVDQRFLVNLGERSLRLPHAQHDASEWTQDTGGRDAQENKLILTGDLYAAVVEWNVLWRVTDPKAYLFNFNGEDGAVGRVIVAVSRSVMHRAVGDYSAEELLTGKREEITQIALKELSDRLDEFGSGISITDLQMQRVTPPDRVRPSFDEVNASIQQRDQLVNEAWRERNQLIPAAEAQSDRLIREAEGYASRELAEAQGEITALLAKYESYQQAPEITRQRLYIETMERVFQNAGPITIIDSRNGSPLPLLNLDSPAKNATPAASRAPASLFTPDSSNSQRSR